MLGVLGEAMNDSRRRKWVKWDGRAASFLREMTESQAAALFVSTVRPLERLKVPRQLHGALRKLDG